MNVCRSKNFFFSGFYDPFLSAKKQLEELFSPTTTPSTQMINSMMAAPSTSNKGNDIMSKSLTYTSQAISSPKTPQPIPKMQSNFKRTSSLRISNRKPKPAIYTPPVKSNIHCGITDDGPISPNFVKATDYDELPIKSPYSAIKMCEQKIIENQVPSRATSPSIAMPSIINKPMMREKSALIRKNLKLDIKNPNMPSSDYPLSKTDSLALFLKYEKELTAKMSEKELKDKSNSLSKRSQGTMNLNGSMMDHKLPDINGRPTMQQQQPQQKFSNGVITDERTLAPIENSNKSHADDSQAKIHSAPSKMSNACDNLPSLTNGNDNDKSRSPSVDSKKGEEDSPNSTRRSGGTTLRRKKKYNMDNILFDTDPEPKAAPASSDNSNNNSLNRPESRISNTESIFEDFDFDQFVASFNDDDQFPIFKDYKMLLNKSATKADEENNNSKNSSVVNQVSLNNANNKTPPALDGVVKNLSETKPIPIQQQQQQQQRSETELSGLEKLDNLCKMLSGNSDSDESNSLETDPSEAQTARSKSSADSAYGR